MKTALATIEPSKDLIYIRTDFVKSLGNLAAASLLSKIVFWHEPAALTNTTKLRIKRGGHLWIANTRQQWMAQCGLTEWTFRSSMKILEEACLIEHKVMKFKGTPTIHVRLLKDPYTQASLEETSNLVLMKPPSLSSGVPTINQENSSKTYTEITAESSSEIGCIQPAQAISDSQNGNVPEEGPIEQPESAVSPVLQAEAVEPGSGAKLSPKELTEFLAGLEA